MQPARVPAEDGVLLGARILLAVLYLVFGWSKLNDPGGTAAYMEHVGAPAPQIAAYLAIAVELVGGLMIILGLATRPIACLLALYTIAAAFIGHPFWNAEGMQRYNDMVNFYKNFCIVGGFVLLMVTGPGRFAIDSRKT